MAQIGKLMSQLLNQFVFSLKLILHLERARSLSV